MMPPGVPVDIAALKRLQVGKFFCEAIVCMHTALLKE